MSHNGFFIKLNIDNFVIFCQKGTAMSQPKLPKECNAISYKTLSLNLKFFRHRLRMTQADVAAQAGISVKYLSLIETASFQNPPTLEVLFDLARVLKVEPYKLFKEI